MNKVAEDLDRLFLGEVASGKEPWMADINIGNKKVTFKIDTGADITAVPETAFKRLTHLDGKLEKASKALYAPGGVKLAFLGPVNDTLSYTERSTAENVFVVRDLQVALLSRKASVRIKLIARVDSIDLQSVKQTCPRICDGLGLVQKPYTTKLKSDAKPFSLKAPRRVPLPLMAK